MERRARQPSPSGASLSEVSARRLNDDGYIVLPGPVSASGMPRLADAYDRAVATADPADVSIRTSTRVHDFVNRGPEFDGLYIYAPLLAACRQVIGGLFKLSSMQARTLEPGSPAPPLHVDVKRHADGWPLVGFIVMVDAFDAENGATRFLPGSHWWMRDPDDSETAIAAHNDEVIACGPAGSMIVFNGSVWHGYGANRSTRRRRSIQGAFIPRTARAATDQSARLRPETALRLSELARWVLDV